MQVHLCISFIFIIEFIIIFFFIIIESDVL